MSVLDDLLRGAGTSVPLYHGTGAEPPRSHSDLTSAVTELLRVPPAMVSAVWPRVRGLVHGAITRTNLGHTRDVDADLDRHLADLWIAHDGAEILAAMVTHLVRTDRELVCIITAVGGSRMAAWLPLQAEVEAFARAEGCARVRIYGRRGWARALRGYSVSHVILERQL